MTSLALIASLVQLLEIAGMTWRQVHTAGFYESEAAFAYFDYDDTGNDFDDNRGG